MQQAGAFLATRPVEHNLLLTIVAQSIEHALDSVYWTVVDGGEVVGFALSSPRGFYAVLSPMPASAARTLADAVDDPIAGVQAEAGVASSFAGRWTERHGSAVTALDGGRFYALDTVRRVANAPGRARLARPDERATLLEWCTEFTTEGGGVPRDEEETVDRLLRKNLLWVWEDDGIRAMTRTLIPVEGVTRVGGVFTPEPDRGHGYATALVEHVSRSIVDDGLRAVLYTQLTNAGSNRIYRRLGYEVVFEIVVYDFER